MSNVEYVHVGSTTDVKPGVGKVFTIDHNEIAVFLNNGTYYAVSNVCPHQHTPLIAEGELDGTTVACPMHGWTFDLCTGKAVAGAGSLDRYEVRIEGTDLYIEKPPPPKYPTW